MFFQNIKGISHVITSQDRHNYLELTSNYGNIPRVPCFPQNPSFQCNVIKFLQYSYIQIVNQQIRTWRFQKHDLNDLIREPLV